MGQSQASGQHGSLSGRRGGQGGLSLRTVHHIVVSKADGEPIQPRSLTHAVSKFLERWNVTLHKLRHSHASPMLAANIHPKVVQERLGHSSISVTMDIYSHLMPNMQNRAAAAVDAAMRAAINRPAHDLE